MWVCQNRDENRNVATFPNESLQLEKTLVNPDQKKHLRGCVRRPALKRSWAAHTDGRKPAWPPGNPVVKGVRDCRSLKERPTIHERKITRNIRINIFVERSKSRKQQEETICTPPHLNMQKRTQYKKVLE